LVVSHNLAVLAGVEPVVGEEDLLRALAERATVNPERITRTVEQLRGGEAFARPVEVLGELLELVDGATRVVDAMGVALA
ncbi:MAG: hypothetical protein RIF41_13075, partial [Polyangiaceae bacterium]